ncbi:MAG: phosphate ABC transporter permease subunit PstC [Vulcanococcus sp.]
MGAGDRLLLWLLRGAAVLAGAIVVLIAAFVWREAWPALQQVGLGRFLSDGSWHPAGGARDGTFGLTPMLLASLLATAGAVLLATPLGWLTALLSAVVLPAAHAQVVRGLLQILGGVPSVVVGFWGLVQLTPLIGRLHPPGQSLLAAILCLTLMILPTTALLSEEALRQVPRPQLQAAALLGLSRPATVIGVMWPLARPALIGAVLLAAGRALGETMAVLMVAGNVIAGPASLFAPVRTLTANIALELGYALELHRSALFVGGLLLMGLVAVVMVGAWWLEHAEAHG